MHAGQVQKPIHGGCKESKGLAGRGAVTCGLEPGGLKPGAHAMFLGGPETTVGQVALFIPNSRAFFLF